MSWSKKAGAKRPGPRMSGGETKWSKRPDEKRPGQKKKIGGETSWARAKSPGPKTPGAKLPGPAPSARASYYFGIW